MSEQEQKRLNEIVQKLAGLNRTSDLTAQEQRDYARLGAQWEQEQPKPRENFGF